MPYYSSLRYSASPKEMEGDQSSKTWNCTNVPGIKSLALTWVPADAPKPTCFLCTPIRLPGCSCVHPCLGCWARSVRLMKIRPCLIDACDESEAKVMMLSMKASIKLCGFTGVAMHGPGPPKYPKQWPLAQKQGHIDIILGTLEVRESSSTQQRPWDGE